MRYGLIAAASVVTASAAQAQVEECATILTPEEAAIHLEMHRLGLSDPGDGPRTLKIVPLTMHVVRRSNGTGGLTPDRVAQALADANWGWSGTGIQFCQFGPIDYINSDTYFDITGTEYNPLRQINVVPGTINIYFVNSAPFCGISSFTTSSVQGIVMNNTCSGVPSNPSTMPHEIGHYFNLYHTHETAFGTECVARTNCATRGDLCCDTPADPTLSDSLVNASCLYVGTAGGPCAGDPPYAPDPRNFMSYSRKLCRDVFTPEQKARAYATLINLRTELNLNLCAPACCVDYTGDGELDFSDIEGFIAAYAAQAPGSCAPGADTNGDGEFDFSDIEVFLAKYMAGC